MSILLHVTLKSKAGKLTLHRHKNEKASSFDITLLTIGKHNCQEKTSYLGGKKHEIRRQTMTERDEWLKKLFLR